LDDYSLSSETTGKWDLTYVLRSANSGSAVISIVSKQYASIRTKQNDNKQNETQTNLEQSNPNNRDWYFYPN